MAQPLEELSVQDSVALGNPPRIILELLQGGLVDIEQVALGSSRDKLTSEAESLIGGGDDLDLVMKIKSVLCSVPALIARAFGVGFILANIDLSKSMFDRLDEVLHDHIHDKLILTH